MTDEQRAETAALRQKGWGYKKISAALGVSVSTVKSYCRKEGLGGVLSVSDRIMDDEHCRECGSLLTQTAGIKRRRFCTPECRIRWWSRHPEAVRHKAVSRLKCPACGKGFAAKNSDARKYCSHGCYIAARFGKGERV